MGENGQKRQFGDYESLELIGDGPQGRVYKACCIAAGNPYVAKGEVVAIRVLRIQGCDEALRGKLRQQADLLRQLAHANIVRYRDFFAWQAEEQAETQCVVMEYLEGEDLRNRLNRTQTGLPWPQVEEIFGQCLAGLMRARECGITHGDINPSNIFITKDGAAKLIDFEIARPDDGDPMSTAGRAGAFDYVAPDFASVDGFHSDEVSDIFSLGVCIYEALTGALPFEPLGESAHAGYLTRWRGGAAPQPSFQSGVFRVLNHARGFVARSVAAQREQRYPSFAAMLEDFRKIRYRRIRHDKDEYELLAVLGSGSGEIFRARKMADGAPVAVRHLPAVKQSERMAKEAAMLLQDTHPNLVKYVDFLVFEGTDGEKQYFLIVEFLEGMPDWTLRSRLENEGRLKPVEAIPLFMSYLSALHFLHERSSPIVHRDIRPGKLFAPPGQPGRGKVLDLGVADTATAAGAPEALGYMPPELAPADGESGSPESDIYALGLCLYESLTGRPAFARLPADPNAVGLALSKQPREASSVSLEAEAFRQYPRLSDVIRRALAEKPADRYRSAAEMRNDLDRALMAKGHEDAVEDDSGPDMATRAFDVTETTRDAPTDLLAASKATDATRDAPPDLLAASKTEATRRKRRRFLASAGGALAVLLLGGILTASIIFSSGRRTAEQARRESELTTQKAEQARRESELAIQKIEQAVSELRSPVPAAAYAANLTRVAENAAKTEARYPSLSGRVGEQRRLLREAGAALPEAFKRSFDSALAAGKTDEAAAILREWQDAEKYSEIMGLTPAGFAERRDGLKRALQRSDVERELAALRLSIPDAIQSDAVLNAGETAAGKLKASEARSWPGFDESEKKQRLTVLSGTLSERMMSYIVRLRDAALTKYRDGQNGDAERDGLRRLPSNAPLLTALTQSAYADATNGVEAARRTWLAAVAVTRLLDRAANARDAESIGTVAGEFLALDKGPEPRLAPEQIKQVEGAIAARYLSFAQSLARQAKTEYDAGRTAEGARQQTMLSDLVASVPDRFGKSALAALQEDVDARRIAAQPVADRRKATRTAGRALADLRARMQKRDVRECTNGIATLAESRAAAMQDPTLKTQWNAALAEYARMMDSAMNQKDPLDQRSQRIRVTDEIVNAPAAAQIFADSVVSLRERLAQQKATFILRIVNKSDQTIRVSGQDLKDKDSLAAGGVREFVLPARGDPALTSFLIEGGTGYKPRTEKVTLVGAGGQELVVGALDKEPVAMTNMPTRPALQEAKTSAPAAGKGILQISVNPKSAAIMVDGKKVDSGPVEVTPDENHRVQAELPGYTTCQQYYRVKPGETRRIEILLPKAEKKSFFSF